MEQYSDGDIFHHLFVASSLFLTRFPESLEYLEISYCGSKLVAWQILHALSCDCATGNEAAKQLIPAANVKTWIDRWSFDSFDVCAAWIYHQSALSWLVSRPRVLRQVIFSLPQSSKLTLHYWFDGNDKLSWGWQRWASSEMVRTAMSVVLQSSISSPWPGITTNNTDLTEFKRNTATVFSLVTEHWGWACCMRRC